MAKITELDAITAVEVDTANDLITVVDVSVVDPLDRNKKMTVDEAKTMLAPDSIGDLGDVDLSGLADGDTLLYDLSNGAFYPGPPPGGSGEIAVYDEGVLVLAAATAINFVGGSVAAVDSGGGLVTVTISGVGGVSVLDDLGDVDLSGLADGDTLFYDLSNGVWYPGAPAVVGGSVSVEDEGVSEATGVSVLNFVGPNVVASDAGGGQVDVTVIQGDPGEATLTKPLASAFTLENAGTASMADGTNGLILTAPSATVNVRFMRYTAGLPGASWTVIMRARQLGPNNGVMHARCIIVRNSTSGRLISFGDTSNTNIGIARWSSYTANNAVPISYGATLAELPWRKVTSNGTTLSFYCSADGQDWVLVGTETIATYLTASGGSLDQVGIGFIFGAASTVEQKNLFQSFTIA